MAKAEPRCAASRYGLTRGTSCSDLGACTVASRVSKSSTHRLLVSGPACSRRSPQDGYSQAEQKLLRRTASHMMQPGQVVIGMVSPRGRS